MLVPHQQPSVRNSRFRGHTIEYARYMAKNCPSLAMNFLAAFEEEMVKLSPADIATYLRLLKEHLAKYTDINLEHVQRAKALLLKAQDVDEKHKSATKPVNGKSHTGQVKINHNSTEIRRR